MTDKDRVIQLLWREKIKSKIPKNRSKAGEFKRNLAESIGISYFTLCAKLSGYSNFTRKQIECLTTKLNK